MKTDILKCAAISLLMAGSSQAGSFTWSNTVLSTNVTSDGSPSPNITFEVIVLSGGFDLADPATWNASNFTSFDLDTYNGSGLNNFGDTAVTAPDNLLAGSEVWIFGYNNLSLMGQAGGEAVLFRDVDWTLPDPSPTSPNSPDTWSPNDTTVVAFGAIDPSYRNSGGADTNTPGELIENLGTFTDPNLVGERTVQTAPFEFQTFTWTTIPEPSSAILGLIGSLVCLRRKRS